MKSLAFLEQVNHNRKVAIYTAQHDGKMRNFAYRECRETFPRLFQDVHGFKGRRTSPAYLRLFFSPAVPISVKLDTTPPGTAFIWSCIEIRRKAGT